MAPVYVDFTQVGRRVLRRQYLNIDGGLKSSGDPIVEATTPMMTEGSA